MMQQRNDRIINISCVVGERGNAGQANYAASKAASRIRRAAANRCMALRRALLNP